MLASRIASPLPLRCPHSHQCLPARVAGPAQVSSQRSPATSSIHSCPRWRLHVAQPSGVSSAAEAEDDPEVPLDELKDQLLDSFFGIDRGAAADSELQAEISELIAALETQNPTEAPNQAVELLNGTWNLAYTSNSELSQLLSLSRLPFLTVGPIQQIVDTGLMTAQNKVTLRTPYTSTAFSADADISAQSPSRLSVKFVRGILQTPQLLQEVEFPAQIYVLGRPVDLTRLRDALQPVNAALWSSFRQVASFVSTQPDLKFQIPSSSGASSWLLNTYLDKDLRISRGDGGSVFVMTRDVAAAFMQATEEPQLMLPAAGQSAAS